MPDVTIAKVAVSGIPFRLDRPYDYAIPAELAESVAPGVRVEVPFTRANRRTEGIVLALAPVSAFEKLKPIDRVLDEAPILTPAQIKLALFLHGVRGREGHAPRGAVVQKRQAPRERQVRYHGRPLGPH